MDRADAAALRAHVREQLLGRCGARAVEQHVTLVDEAGAHERLGDLADHAVATGPAPITNVVGLRAVICTSLARRYTTGCRAATAVRPPAHRPRRAARARAHRRFRA